MGMRVLQVCNRWQILLSFISIHQYHSLWSIGFSTLLTLSSSSVIIFTRQTSQSSSSSSSLISLSDLTSLIIVNLTHLTQLIINLSHKSHLTNLIRLVHLTVTNNSLATLTISLTKETVPEVIIFLSFFLIVFNNCYGIGNNVWKFQVSTMKIVPVACIWSLCIIRITMTQRFLLRGSLTNK